MDMTTEYPPPPPYGAQPLVSQDLLLIETSRSHAYTLYSVRFLWTSDQPVAETSTWQDTTLTRVKHKRSRGIRTFPVSERRQTHAVDRAATEIFDHWNSRFNSHSETEHINVDKKNQLDVTFCILYFSSNCCSTCFGQPCAHHQELTTAWCYSLVLVCAVAAGRWSSSVGR